MRLKNNGKSELTKIDKQCPPEYVTFKLEHKKGQNKQVLVKPRHLNEKIKDFSIQRQVSNITDY